MQGVPGGFSALHGPDDFVAGDRVAIETEIGGRRTALRAVVVRVHPDALWIALSSPDRRVALLQAGQPLHLTFSRDEGAVVATSTFLHAIASEPERLFAVERPATARTIERRQCQRVQVATSVRVSAINGAPATGPEANATNLAAGGLLLETGMFLCVGDMLSVALVLESRDIVNLDAQVIRIDDPQRHGSASHGPPYKVAIRFVEPGAAAQDRITRFLLDMQRVQRDKVRVAG